MRRRGRRRRNRFEWGACRSWSESTPALPDIIVLGDVLIAAQGRFFRVVASCNDSLCTVSFQGESDTVDLRNVDPNSQYVTITNRRTRNGVQTGRAVASADGFAFNTFGIWGDYNAGTSLCGSITLQGASAQFAIPSSIGMRSGSNPVTGSATWTGAMVGVTVGRSSLGPEVTADADMTVNLGAASLELAFTNIADRSGVRSDDIRWQGVPMHGGSFQAAGPDGHFYGPNHEEAGGVFRCSGIEGAFSLARQQPVRRPEALVPRPRGVSTLRQTA